MGRRRERRHDELDVAIQNATIGRSIMILDLLKLRPEAERQIAEGATVAEAAEAAVLMYAQGGQ